MGKIKLSTAQLALLKERSGSFVETYKPGMKLKELGLIDCDSARFNIHWKINLAGEAYLVSVGVAGGEKDGN